MPPRRSRFAEALADFALVCDELGLGWYVFGAQAALLYGAARLTADIDVTVRLGTVPVERLVQQLSRAGFELRATDADFIANTRVLPVLHRSGIPLDIVLSGPGLEDSFIERARTRDVGGGVRVPVACVEDLIVMKVLAGRPKDEDDVLAMLAATGQPIDLTLLRGTLAMLEEALGQSDLTPKFDELLTRSGR